MAGHIEVTIPVVMISSTVLDLSEYREQALDACWRMEMFPKMMEHLPAVDADAIAESIRMVDQADIYVGIFASRYGYVPADHDKSITEMEYDRAVERGIPRLIFLAEPGTANPGKIGGNDTKLVAFKARIEAERVVSYFGAPHDLRLKLVESLSRIRTTTAATARIHPAGDMVEPPAPYIAHAYTLLQTPNLIGREQDLEILTDWVTRQEQYREVPVLTLVAIGGMGKSALSWKWFNEIVPQQIEPLAGRVWWSFYESDATFENFVTRTLAYVSRRSVVEVEKEAFPERERALLRHLDCEPHVVVMDGLERLLIAYARADAPHLMDEEVEDSSATESGIALVTGTSSFKRYQLRKTADTRVGQFLRKLTGVKGSRILISTRLFPADLQMGNDKPLAGCYWHDLEGLNGEDALALWQAYDAKGSLETMAPLFHRVGSHPLLIQVLASEVVHHRQDPGNFESWSEAHPDFDPFTIPLVQVKSHVLDFAMRGLSNTTLRVLQVIAAFRMPVNFDTLQALLLKGDKPANSDPDEGSYGSILSWNRGYDEETDTADRRNAPFAVFENLQDLDWALSDLEDRGLLGWDRQTNRYDLHPIVRGVAWSSLQNDTRQNIHERLRVHFEAMPRFDREKTTRVEDMTPAIELFHTLMSLGRNDEAAGLYSYQLGRLYDVDPNLSVEMLGRLFAESGEDLGIDDTEKGQLLRNLGIAYTCTGRPDLVTEVVPKALDSLSTAWDRAYPLCDVSQGCCMTGRLFEAERSAREALIAAREADPRWLQPVALLFLARCLHFQDRLPDAMLAINRSQKMFQRRDHTDFSAQSRMLGVELLLWRGFDKEAEQVASMIWDEGETSKLVGRPFVRVPCQRLWGLAQAYLGNPDGAEDKLHYAITQAHADFRVDEELAATIALAEIRRLQSQPELAAQLLEDARALAERGRYQLFVADIHNLSARIAADAGDTDSLVANATAAYRLSWCDGPPFAYYWGMYEAAAQLRSGGADVPDDLEPFDEIRRMDMPTVEINPHDEWYVDENEYASILISGFGGEPKP